MTHRGPFRRALRLLAEAAAGLLVLVVAVAFALPLYFRGARLGRVLERVAPPLCGRVSVAGGALAPTAVFDVLFGWPTTLELDGVALVAPDGEVVLGAGQIVAHLRVGLRARSIDVQHLMIDRAVFRLEEGGGRRGLFAAVRPAPSRDLAGRCPAEPTTAQARSRGTRTARAPRAEPAARASSGKAMSLRVDAVELKEAKVVLDFPDWALVIERASARGTASAWLVDGAGPQVRFAVTDVDAAAGGSLRVGSAREGWATTVPFTRTRIGRVAVTDAAPGALELVVTGAESNRARLSGRALFENVFTFQAPRGRDWMDIAARWDHIGGAFAAAQGEWKRALAFLDPGDLNVEGKIAGPFTRPSAGLRVFDERIDAEAHVDPDLEIGASARFTGFDTTTFLPRSLRPTLAGVLSGRIALSAQLATALGRMNARLDDLDLSLARHRRGPFPTTVRVRRDGEPAESGPDLADLIVGSAALDQGILRLADLRGRIYGARLRGAATAALIDPRGDPGRAARVVEPGFDARLDVSDLDLKQAVPGRAVSGRLDFGLRVHGPADELAIGIGFHGDRIVTVLGESLRLPAHATARILGGDTLAVTRVGVERVGGGALVASGRVVVDGDVNASLGIERWPLASLPGLRGSGVRLGGSLGAALQLAGRTQAPTLHGQVTLDDVRLGQARLGSGGLVVRKEHGGFAFEGRVVDRVVTRGRARLGSQPELSAFVAVKELPLEPFGILPEALVTGVASAEALIVVGAERSLSIDGRLNELRLVVARPGQAGTLPVSTTGPAPCKLSDGTAECGPVTIVAPGTELLVQGQGSVDAWTATAKGEIGLASLQKWLAPAVRALDGRLAVALAVAGGGDAAPVPSGQVKIVAPLGVVPRAWPAGLRVPTGEINVNGDRMDLRDLAVEAFGGRATLAGRLDLDRQDVRASRADWSASGRVVAAELARFVPKLIASAEGEATFELRGTGRLTAPALQGHVELAGLSALAAPLPVRVHVRAGRLVAAGQRLEAHGLDLAVDRGQLSVGRPGAPAFVELASLAPPRVGALSVPIAARGLGLALPRQRLNVDDVDATLRLERRADGQSVLVVGDVNLHRASFAVGASKPRGPATPAPRPGPPTRSPSAPKMLVALDVQGRSDPGALTVEIPVLWDLGLTMNCHVTGSPGKPKLDGRIRGAGAYSGALLWLYDLFAGKDIRSCQLP